MTERSPASLDTDPTVRLKGEEIDEIGRITAPLIPGETRTFLPSGSDESEQTLFRMSDRPLEGSEASDLFSFHTNESGQWVLEGTGAEGDVWIIPNDVEFSLGSDGVTMRARGDKPEAARPLGLGRLPLVAQRLVMQAVNAREKGGDFSKIVIMAHPSASGEQPLLTVRNASTNPLAMETHRDTLQNEERGATSDASAEAIVDESAKEVPVETNVSEPETTQEVNMTSILAEGQELPPEPLIEEEGGVVSEDHEGEAEADQPKEVAPESKMSAPPVAPRTSLSVEARLAGLDEEPVAETEFQTRDTQEEQFSIEGLDAAAALKSIIEHFSHQLDQISKKSASITEEYVRMLPEVFRTGQTVAQSGVLENLDEMKKVFDDDKESLDHMSDVAGKYLTSEQGIFSAHENVSEDVEAQQKLRQAATELVEKLQETLKKMEQATTTVLTLHRIIDSEIRTISGVYYPDVPGYGTIRDTVLDKTRALVNAVNERAESGREVRRNLTELEELQKSMLLQ